MRVTGGDLRSRQISAPRGLAVRPTPARVKEALFSILAERINAARVLDLYAGSGAIGFEALSRGAAHVTCVEIHAPTAAAIRTTAERLGLARAVAVICAPAERAAQRVAGRFDIVYADPPYALPPPHLSLGTLKRRGAIDRHSIVIYEHHGDAATFVGAGFAETRQARYGDVTLQFLRIDDGALSG